MKGVMAHLGDEHLPYELIRFHSTEACARMRELADYVSMLMARCENTNSRAVLPEEMTIVECKASTISDHLRVARSYTQVVAQEHTNQMVRDISSESPGSNGH